MRTSRVNMGQMSVGRKRSQRAQRSGADFGEVLRSGGNMLLQGVQAAAGSLGIPGLSGSLAQMTSSSSASSSVSAAPGQSPGSDIDAMAKLQQDRMSSDLELLELQQSLHRQNREVALVSNVMKAKHDTTKNAIANLRA